MLNSEIDTWMSGIVISGVSESVASLGLSRRFITSQRVDAELVLLEPLLERLDAAGLLDGRHCQRACRAVAGHVHGRPTVLLDRACEGRGVELVVVLDLRGARRA